MHDTVNPQTVDVTALDDCVHGFELAGSELVMAYIVMAYVVMASSWPGRNLSWPAEQRSE